MGKIYKNDIGTKLRFCAATDISDASVVRVYYKKPSGATGYWDGELWDGTWTNDEGYIYDNTWLQYITTDGDLDEGNDDTAWEFQIYVETPAWKGRGETVLITVYETL